MSSQENNEQVENRAQIENEHLLRECVASVATSNTCVICGKSDRILRCSRCKSAVYCSREHQKLDWKHHKVLCLPVTHSTVSSSVQPAASESTISAFSVNSSTTFLPSHFSPSHVNVSYSSVPLGSPVVAKTQTSNLEINRPSQDLDTNFAQKNTIKENFVVNKSKGENSICSVQTQGENKCNVQFENVNTNNNESIGRRKSNIDGRMSPIVREGSSENTVLEACAESLNPVEESSRTLNSFSPISAARMLPTNRQNEAKSVTNAPRRENNSNTEDELQLQRNRFTEKLRTISENLVHDLNVYGVCLVDNFLGVDKGNTVLNEVLCMYRAGLFEDGQLVSKKPGSRDSKTIRGDRIMWLDGKEEQCKNIGMLISQVDAIVMKANKMPNNGKMGNYTINGRTKAMLACYPGHNSHYVKHVDNPNHDGRCITAIYYLNKDWVAEDGGLLRIYPEDTNQVANIEPMFDRLLFFWSDRRNPHEVLPAKKMRYAITLWYFDAEERNRAYRKYQEEKDTDGKPT